MIIKRVSIASILFLFLALAGCNWRNSSDLEVFLEDLQEYIDEEKLEKYKSGSIDSTGKLLDLVVEETTAKFSRLDPDSGFRTSLDSMFGSSEEIKVTYLAITLHRFLNKAPIDIDSVLPILKKIEYHKWAAIASEASKEKLRLAALNDSAFGIGDTITVFLPIHDSFGEKSTFFYVNSMPVYPKDIDSLELVGTILDKYYGQLRSAEVDSADLIFSIRVSSISREDVLIYGNHVLVGDTIDFPVTYYGRLIVPHPTEQ